MCVFVRSADIALVGVRIGGSFLVGKALSCLVACLGGAIVGGGSILIGVHIIC